ncbi:hypothetical protein [Vagococcus sp.]|uniref:hypothetical protein n=1 Tax=Vagococcus sp. TaxID=1933889 RepID=UPI003F958CE2
MVIKNKVNLVLGIILLISGFVFELLMNNFAIALTFIICGITFIMISIKKDPKNKKQEKS